MSEFPEDTLVKELEKLTPERLRMKRKHQKYKERREWLTKLGFEFNNDARISNLRDMKQETWSRDTIFKACEIPTQRLYLWYKIFVQSHFSLNPRVTVKYRDWSELHLYWYENRFWFEEG